MNLLLFLFSGYIYGLIEYSSHLLYHFLQIENNLPKIPRDEFYKTILFLFFSMTSKSELMLLLWTQYFIYKCTNQIIQNFTDMYAYRAYHNLDKQYNYGVTTPFWDYMFDTMEDDFKKRVRKTIYISWIPFFSFLNYKISFY